MTFLDPYIGMLKAAAAVGSALGMLWIGYHFGAQGVQTKWDKDNAARAEATNRAIFDQIKANERQAEQQALVNQKLKKGYADEIAQVRAAAARDRGLRLPASVCSGFAATTEANGTSRSDAAAAGAIPLPEPIDRDLRQLMQEADTVLAGCRVAQGFIRENGFAP